MNSWRRRRGVYDTYNVAELQRRRHFDKVSGVLFVKVQARGFAQRGGSKKGEPIQVVVANTKMSKFGRAARTLYEADSNTMVMLGSFVVDGLGSRSSCLPLIWASRRRCSRGNNDGGWWGNKPCSPRRESVFSAAALFAGH